MRKILFAALATLSGLILLFSYRTSTQVQTPPVGLEPGASATTVITPSPAPPQAAPAQPPAPTASPPAATPAPPPPAAPAPAAPGLADGTFTGGTVNTHYGPVQVQITITGGQITAATAVQYPQGRGRTDQISAYAIPQLEAEAVAAQGGSIRLIGGATYTSQGFAGSLQDALNQAGG